MNIIREHLISLADSKYAEFAAKLLPAGTNIVGVRLPLLRRFSQELALTEEGLFFANTSGAEEIFEEKMLRGMVIGKLNMPINDKLNLIERFIPQIDNWSVCDSFCASLKVQKEDKNIFFDFLKSCMSSAEEFRYRFGVVMLKNLYLERCYIRQVIELLCKGCPNSYYAQMGAAWTICEAYIRFPDEISKLLRSSNLSDKVKMLSMRKIRESQRT